MSGELATDTGVFPTFIRRRRASPRQTRLLHARAHSTRPCVPAEHRDPRAATPSPHSPPGAHKPRGAFALPSLIDRISRFTTSEQGRDWPTRPRLCNEPGQRQVGDLAQGSRPERSPRGRRRVQPASSPPSFPLSAHGHLAPATGRSAPAHRPPLSRASPYAPARREQARRRGPRGPGRPCGSGSVADRLSRHAAPRERCQTTRFGKTSPRTSAGRRYAADTAQEAPPFLGALRGLLHPSTAPAPRCRAASTPDHRGDPCSPCRRGWLQHLVRTTTTPGLVFNHQRQGHLSVFAGQPHRAARRASERSRRRARRAAGASAASGARVRSLTRPPTPPPGRTTPGAATQAAPRPGRLSASTTSPRAERQQASFAAYEAAVGKRGQAASASKHLAHRPGGTSPARGAQLLHDLPELPRRRTRLPPLGVEDVF